jgi:hypothetical protein
MYRPKTLLQVQETVPDLGNVKRPEEEGNKWGDKGIGDEGIGDREIYEPN